MKATQVQVRHLPHIIFFCRLCQQYRRYKPEGEEQDIDEPEFARPRSTTRSTSFKDFLDKKEDEVKESIKRKSADVKQAGQSSDGHRGSPSGHWRLLRSCKKMLRHSYCDSQ